MFLWQARNYVKMETKGNLIFVRNEKNSALMFFRHPWAVVTKEAQNFTMMKREGPHQSIDLHEAAGFLVFLVLR